MFRKFFMFVMFACACGYVFASDSATTDAGVWPEFGDAADVRFNMDGGAVVRTDNVRIDGETEAEVVIENNFNGRGDAGFWSGGADLTQPYQVSGGFNMENASAQMPLMHMEMMEDDGGAVLAVSKSNRVPRGLYSDHDIAVYNNFGSGADDAEFDVVSSDSGEVRAATDSVRSWVVASGQTLRSVLQDWADKEGWDLVWNTSREYPVQASAVFKGRFMDVASGLVRNFSRAMPVPYAKFYKGNRVLVITTNEE
ncbi:MAG: toxin co-regulated pilus biosynthesis Q family protein [Rickettsiales bacterium]|jgi:hypothetical protein|nr:toxin co-regulated pilus biosynthesis Q family protein [Rickettsiales bacterium]